MKFIYTLVIIIICFHVLSPVTFAQNAVEKFRYRNNEKLNLRTGIIAAKYNINSQIFQGAPEDIARQYLNQDKTSFGISNVSNLKHTRTIYSHGTNHVGFIQTFQGVPIYESESVVSINKENRVTMVVNGNMSVELNSISPQITQEKAISKVVKKIKVDTALVVTKPKAELYIYQDSLFQFILTWKINFIANDPMRMDIMGPIIHTI